MSTSITAPILLLASSLSTGIPPISANEVAELRAAVKASQMAGDNAWMLISSALVLLMTGPGLALFYSGLVRRRTFSAP